MDIKIPAFWRLSPPQAPASADAKMAIKRDESEEGKKRKHKDFSQNDTADDNDEAHISIGSLKAFLQDILNSHEGRKTAGDDLLPHEEAASLGNAARNRAISAYQHASHEDEKPRPAENATSGTKIETELDEEAITLIRQMLLKLDSLSRDGHEEIKLSTSGSFLDSIKSALNNY